MKKLFIVLGILFLLPICRVFLLENAYWFNRYVFTIEETGQQFTHVTYDAYTHYIILGNKFFIPDSNYVKYRGSSHYEYGFDLYWNEKKYLISIYKALDNKMDTNQIKVDEHFDRIKSIEVDSTYRRAYFHFDYNLFTGLGILDALLNRDFVEKSGVEVSYF